MCHSTGMASSPPSTPGPDDAAEPGPSASHRRVVLVAGSGRSGTSTIAGILKELGVHVPQPEVDADETNPKGFAEPRWLVDFHTEMLKAAGAQISDARPDAWAEAGRVELAEETRRRAAEWLEPHFDRADELVLKDPRLIWFLGLWQATARELGAESSVLIMLRPPTEVVGSKRTYYGYRGEIDGVAGWLNLMLHTERATRGTRRAFVLYHDLLDDWTVAVSRLGEAFDLGPVKHADADRVDRIHRFVDPTLRRVAGGWEDLDVPEELRTLADQTWSQLVRLAAPGGDTPAVQTALDALMARYTDYYADAEAVATSSVLAARRRAAERMENVKERNAALRRRVAELEQRVGELERPSAYDRMTGALPVGVRRRVPASWRRRVRALAERRRRGAERD